MLDQGRADAAEIAPTTSETHTVAQFLRRFHVALVSVDGDDVGEHILVTRLPFVVGRGRAATMRVSDETISRRHALIRLDADGQLEVLDPGSSNGTFVNGARVECVRLADGDQIRFGSAAYEVVIEERYVGTGIAD